MPSDPRLAVQVYERTRSGDSGAAFDLCATGTSTAWLVPHRESHCFWSVLQRQSRRSRRLSLMPSGRTLRRSCGGGFAFPRLAFARWSERVRVTFA